MAPKIVKCKRFIAGLYKYRKNKQCPCYDKTRDVGACLLIRLLSHRGCTLHVFDDTKLPTGRHFKREVFNLRSKVLFSLISLSV